MGSHTGSSRWDAWNESGGPQYPHEKVVQYVLRHFAVPLQENLHALDLGCGSGVHTKFLVDCGFKVLGIDGSRIGVENTATLLAEQRKAVRLEVALLSSFNVEPSTFDCVICVGVLDAAGYREAQSAVPRVIDGLKSGGRAIFVFAADGDFRISSVPELGLHGYTRDEVERLFGSQSGIMCNIDQYVTTYESDRIRQIDWLVTLVRI